MIELFDKKQDCCGCLACMNICPKNAIITEVDKDGFIFPVINKNLCIECGLCNKVCSFQNLSVSGNKPIDAYVAINKDIDMLKASASGGIFGALAKWVLEKDGVVFGCAYDEQMKPVHIGVNNLKDIKKIQGSKYVQSNINMTYTEVKKHLKSNKWVLFTGTPCQVAGLKSYLGRAYDKLIMADIICHGVPSIEFFKGYIQYLEKELKGNIIDVKFRDKSKGWGHVEKVTYKKGNSIKEKLIYPINSYYHSLFLKGDLCRESCYICKYASGTREGDFTMGDYWGVKKAHPEIKAEKGVSVLLVNTKKGVDLINYLEEYLSITQSTFKQAKLQNGPLNKPNVISPQREIIFKLWRENGYKGVSDYYYQTNRKQIISARYKRLIPDSLKRQIKDRLIRKDKD